MNISESEIFEAIRASRSGVGDRPKDVSTVRELALAWNVGVAAVKRRIAPLRESGQMERVLITAFDVLGHRQQVPAYRMVKKVIAPEKWHDTPVIGAKKAKVAR